MMPYRRCSGIDAMKLEVCLNLIITIRTVVNANILWLIYL